MLSLSEIIVFKKSDTEGTASVKLHDEEDPTFFLKINNIKINLNDGTNQVSTYKVDGTNMLSGTAFDYYTEEIYQIFIGILEREDLRDGSLFRCYRDEDGDPIIEQYGGK